MDIGKPTPPMISMGFHCKNPASKVDLWKSLLNPQMNDSALVTNDEDVTLQGISLLLGTTFFHFKDIYFQLLSTKKELENVRRDLESSMQTSKNLKGALKKAQSDCKSCAKLQKELSEAEEQKKKFQRVLAFAITTLDPPDGCKPPPDSQKKKACNIMTQALQGSQDISTLDDTLVGDSPLAEMWRSTNHKRSLEAISSPNEILGTPENQPFPKRSFKLHHRTHSDKNSPSVVIPESFADEENTAPSPVKRSDPGNADRKVLCDVSLNVQTTPKKGVSKPNEGSPILGNSHKKTGKGGTPVPADNAPAFCHSPLITKNFQPTQDLLSPSLLNSEQLTESKTSNIKGPLAAVKCAGSSGSQQGSSKVVKLESIGHDVTFERRPGSVGVKKMKQQKLSLSSFHRSKQDISTFKEFNGGIRAQPSDFGYDNLDEERQLEWAKQESLLEEQKRKDEEARLLISDTSDATFYFSAANHDDSIIAGTPQTFLKPPVKKLETNKRASPETLSTCFEPKITSTMITVESSMDAFAPDYCSTAKNQLDESCTPNAELEALADALDIEDSLPMSQPKCLETSFDRLPRREKISPNYKYKRDPVRKKCDRQKIPGHGDKCCNGYYHENGADPNKVSKHRDHYGFQTNTPPDYWDPSFPRSK